MIVNKSLLFTLSRNLLFSGLPPETLEGIVAESRRIQGKKGQELFSIGDSADAFFYVVEGWVKLYRLNREGEEAVIHVIAPGETFAEAAVFGHLRKYPVNAQYVEDSTLLAIPRSSFTDRIAATPDLALHILGAISARQRYLIQQIEQLTVKDAPQRIGTFLLHLCQSRHPTAANEPMIVDLPYDKILISRRLNIQPETFSRALKKLKNCGVKADGHKVIIGDLNKLANYCEIDDRAALC
jgi:CRP-like cAMP-binding protein